MIDWPDFTHAPVLAFFVAFALVFGLAIRFGGWPERCGALTLLAMPVVQLTLYSVLGTEVYGAIDWPTLVVDVMALAGFSAIAWYAYGPHREYWTTAAWGMCIISVLSHFVRFNTDMLGMSYATFKTAFTGAVILLVLAGTVAQIIRKRMGIVEPDWIPREYGLFRKLPEKLDDL